MLDHEAECSVRVQLNSNDEGGDSIPGTTDQSNTSHVFSASYPHDVIEIATHGCAYGCDFIGTFDQVLAHHLICKNKSEGQ